MMPHIVYYHQNSLQRNFLLAKAFMTQFRNRTHEMYGNGCDAVSLIVDMKIDSYWHLDCSVFLFRHSLLWGRKGYYKQMYSKA